ncbi:DUF4142 domain-containing protein [Nocardiopsis sp. RSe5-2]|uniref:DUF4142 domain-containing protein n=1 Tax=Nocardiopsis endophytica TaxID=3018445 RepID=A0ABT4TX28_9ACTN|nr:DUF4142 domain-containing protein [Nocardiopsis endophytica]MDA2809243.1 DUF4142 domain-containing protein [Nocardiopsis endophytica]
MATTADTGTDPSPGRGRRRLGMRPLSSLGAIEFAGVAAFLVVSAITVFMVVPHGSMSAAGVFWREWEMTDHGPLGPADRDALAKVRQANLWEIPTGQQAEERARSDRVREVGGILADDHALMDEQVREVARELEVELPSMPSAQQQDWMDELAGLSGDAYDRTAVNRLRFAHGEVIQVLAEVRAGTRNSLVRSFVQHAMFMVLKHITLLESTGLVDFERLPEPPPPERRRG